MIMQQVTIGMIDGPPPESEIGLISAQERKYWGISSLGVEYEWAPTRLC